MKALKTKVVITIALVAIFISASTVNVTTSQSSVDYGPELEVQVKVKNLFRGLYLIWTTVKNLEDKGVILTIGRPAGGIYIRSDVWWGVYEYRKPGFTTMRAYKLFLRPAREKLVYIGLWNMDWASPQVREPFFIFGYLRNYTYNGNTYPIIYSDPYFVIAN